MTEGLYLGDDFRENHSVKAQKRKSTPGELMDSMAIIVECRHQMIALSEERRNAEEQGNEERVCQLTLEINLFSASIEKKLRYLRSQLPEEGG